MRVSGRAAALCLAASLVATPGFGAEAEQGEDGLIGQRVGLTPGIDYVLRAGVSYTDNLFRSPAGLESSSGAAVLGVFANGQRDTGRLTYRTAVDLWYNAYFSEFDSQVFGGATFDGAYAFVEDTFLWNGSFAYNQVRQDISAPLAPGNMGAQVNWSTGPEFRFRFGQALEAQLSAHYQAASYPGDQAQGDNTTIGGRALLARRSGPRSMIALGASVDDLRYDQDLVAELFDFTRREVFARYETSGVRNRIAAEAGYSTVSGSNVDDSGPVFRGTFSRRLTPTLDGFLSYVREYPVSSPQLRFEDPAEPGTGTPDETLLTSSPRIAQTFGATLAMERTRTNARLSYSLRKEESLLELLGKRDYSDLRFFVQRQFTPKASGAFFVSLTSDNFTAFAEDADETTVGGLFTIMLGGSLGLDLQLEHRDRDSENPMGSSKELSGGIFLRYSGAFGRRAPSSLESMGLQ